MAQAKTISETLAGRVREVREDRGYSLRELARRMNELGHTIDASGLMRLESGERRTTVDDLIAVSVALDVSPDVLLLPLTDDEQVDVPGLGGWPSGAVRDWITGRVLLFWYSGDEHDIDAEALAKRARWLNQRPIYEQRAFEHDGAETLLREPHMFLRSFSGDWVSPTPGNKRKSLERIRAAVDLLLSEEE